MGQEGPEVDLKNSRTYICQDDGRLTYAHINAMPNTCLDLPIMEIS